MPPVSTASTVRSPSASTAVARPCTARPSAKVTSVVRSRRLWALVATRPSPTTTPQPRPPPRPMRTTAGATASATRPTVVCWSTSAGLMVSSLVVSVSSVVSLVTCKLQVTCDVPWIRASRTVVPPGPRRPGRRPRPAAASTRPSPGRPRSWAIAGACWSWPGCCTGPAGSASCSTSSTGWPPTSCPGGSNASRATGSSSASRTRRAPSGTPTASPPRVPSWPTRCGCWPGGPRDARGPTTTPRSRATTPAGRRCRRRWYCATCDRPVERRRG